MAKADINAYVNGLRGKTGDVIFRMVGSQCIVSRAPGKRDKQKETRLQAGTRSRFRDASALAKEKMKDPVLKAHYASMAKRLELPNAYTAAVKELMTVNVSGVGDENSRALTFHTMNESDTYFMTCPC